MNLIKRLSVFVMSLLVGMVSYANDVYEVTATRLNVRASRTTDARVVGTINKGQKIEVEDINASWATIKYNGKTAYVSTRFLKYIGPTVFEIPVEDYDDLYVPSRKTRTETKKESVDDVISSFKSRHSGKNAQKSRKSRKSRKATASDEMPTLLNGPLSISDDMELYYGVSAGAGFSSFLWSEGLAGGKLSYTGDLFAQLYFNRSVGFIPQNYYAELQLGYDSRGASNYDMNYVHARIYPFGYKMELDAENHIKLIGKLGAGLGLPLSKLETTRTPKKTWDGNFQVGVAAAVGVEYRQFAVSANVEYDFTGVASNTPITLNNIAILGTISYTFGKLKH